MSKLVLVIAMALSSLLTGGCSVGMALHGADNPDLAVLKAGAHRSAIESQLKKPKLWDPNDSHAVYHYATGEDGSPGRAIAHGVGDVLTLGLWEVVGTPVEAVQTHDKWTVTVWYNKDEKVIRWDGPVRR